jgi:DNA-binding CsgD family transcriptional regulator
VHTGRYEFARAQTNAGLEIAIQAGHQPMVACAKWFLAELNLIEGRVDEAQAAGEEAIELLRPTDVKNWIAWCLVDLARTAHAKGDIVGSYVYAEEALEIARAAILTREEASALLTLSALARTDGTIDRAEDVGHDALRVAAAGGWRMQMIDALEALAGLGAVQESHVEAGRLYGAAQAARDTIGYVRYPIEREAYQADVDAVRVALGDAFEATWKEGAALTLEEAVAYAQRGRGERKRPSTGWASLTPAELDVTRLVAEGLSNREIADRLFVSPRTVQTHLTHVYSKLDVTSRVQLAQQSSSRAGDARSAKTPRTRE